MVSPASSKRQIHGGVRLRSGMRLNVGVGRTEQLLGAVNRQLFGDVDELTAAVIALAGITLGVLIREYRALCLEHARTGVVFRRNELDVVFLALALISNGFGQLRIETFNDHMGRIHVASTCLFSEERTVGMPPEGAQQSVGLYPKRSRARDLLRSA